MLRTFGRVSVPRVRRHSIPQNSSVHKLLSPTTSRQHIQYSHPLMDQYRRCSSAHTAHNCSNKHSQLSSHFFQNHFSIRGKYSGINTSAVLWTIYTKLKIDQHGLGAMRSMTNAWWCRPTLSTYELQRLL